MNDKPTTEQTSRFDDLDQMPLKDLLFHMNQEDRTVPAAVAQKLDQIEALVNHLVVKMKSGGRLFYIGAGTSGRLGIVDASECPPTFGVEHGIVVGLIAGGDRAIRKAVEFAEDDFEQGWKDLQDYEISPKDFVVGIAASGRTPYVIGALEKCQSEGIATGCITCNEETQVAKVSDYPIEIVVGPEFVTGSTRMKSGTAQKLALNMITTTAMIQLGKVKGNKMVDMQLSNEKLWERGTKMIVDELQIDRETALKLLQKHGSVRKAVINYHKENNI